MRRFYIFLSLLLIPSFIVLSQPTEEDILAMIEDGIEWLVPQQHPTYNYWWDNSRGEPVATTAFAVTKLCDYAFEHGYSPFDPEYEYSENVIKGFDYIFSQVKAKGPGLCATTAINSHHETYNAATALMAIAACKTPDRVISSSNILVNGLTFFQLQEKMVDYFEWGQAQNPAYAAFGGWDYYSFPTNTRSDNSISGWVVLALRYAEVNGSTIDPNLKIRLNSWVDYIQVDYTGAYASNPLRGGSGYSSTGYWVNLLKTGNLLMQFAFLGDAVTSPRVQAAIGYIERNWGDMRSDPGRGDTQVMYCLMKGFESFSIEEIHPGGIPTNWFDDFTTELQIRQAANGSWDYSYWTGYHISTCWALMVLEKVAPPPACPENISVANNPGACGAIVEYNISAHYDATIVQTDGTGLTSGDEFPVGETYQEYTITHDTEETICSFYITVTDTEPPVALCNDVDVYLDENGEGSTTLAAIDGGSSDNCPTFIVESDDLNFNCEDLGANPVTLTITDASGLTDQCTSTVTVIDDLPPVLTAIVEPIILWSPNHKYKSFDLDDFDISVSDNCTPLTQDDVKIILVTSDEVEEDPEDGDGETYNDMVIGDNCQSVQVRSERSGDKNGRVYTIYLMAEDNSGNSTTVTVQIHVPHNNNPVAIDDGPVYEVYGDCDAELAEMKSQSIGDSNLQLEEIKLTNYPNPFSQSTLIEYTIPENAKVQLSILNVSGQTVKELVNRTYTPGTYTVEFTADGFTSGFYFYRLVVNNVTITKKMVINK